MLARIWRKGNPSMLLVEMQIGAAMMENNMIIPRKWKYNCHTIQQFHSFLYAKKMKALIQKGKYTPMF